MNAMPQMRTGEVAAWRWRSSSSSSGSTGSPRSTPQHDRPHREEHGDHGLDRPVRQTVQQVAGDHGHRDVDEERRRRAQPDPERPSIGRGEHERGHHRLVRQLGQEHGHERRHEPAEHRRRSSPWAGCGLVRSSSSGVVGSFQAEAFTSRAGFRNLTCMLANGTSHAAPRSLGSRLSASRADLSAAVGRLAQLARAPPLQGGGRGFEPLSAHRSTRTFALAARRRVVLVNHLSTDRVSAMRGYIRRRAGQAGCRVAGDRPHPAGPDDRVAPGRSARRRTRSGRPRRS